VVFSFKDLQVVSYTTGADSMGHFSTRSTALVIVSLAMLINMGTGNVTLILLMVGRSSLNLLNTGAALTVNVLLNVVLVPQMGVTGAALAWAAAIILENLLARV